MPFSDDVLMGLLVLLSTGQVAMLINLTFRTGQLSQANVDFNRRLDQLERRKP